MRFSLLHAYLGQLTGEGVPGLEMTVWKDHREIFSFRAGEAPALPGPGAFYWLYSATKITTMTLAMQAVEKGLVRLSDPVSAFLPAYADLTVREGDGVRRARTVMTLQHLMAMQGGLDYDLDAPEILETVTAHQGNASTREVALALARRPLHFDPGCGFRYSLCHDVVGAVLETVHGLPLSAIARRDLFGPLGITELTFHPSGEMLARLAPQYRLTPSGLVPVVPNRIDPLFRMPRYESGGGGLCGTADAMIRLADALACGGTGANGQSVLSAASIDEMRTDRLHGKAREDFARIRHKKGYGYGLGVRTLVDTSSSLSPAGEFGWDGAAGAWVLMDPENRLSAVYLHHVLEMNEAYYTFHSRIRDLIYTGLKEA